MAVLGDITDTAPKPGVHVARVQRPTVHVDLSGRRLHEPGDRIGDRRGAGASKSVEPDALADVHVEAHVLDRPQRCLRGEVADAQAWLPVAGVRPSPLLPNGAGELAANHCSYEMLVIELRHGCGDDPLAVAEHGRSIADLVDLLEMVRDVEDRDAARLHATDAIEQPLDRVRLERRRGLVENEEARADPERARDLDDLLLLDRELDGRLVDVEVETPLEQKLPRLPAQLLPADERPVAAVEEDVLADAERRDDHRALVHASAGSPYRRTLPRSGFSKPVRTPTSVDLPAPFRPTSA